MTIIVSTCDKYDHLLPGFAMQWNRYWGVEVTVLGFREPPSLPTNFTFVSMGVEKMSWSAHLRQAIESINDDKIVFLFDDYWLIDHVDAKWVNDMSAFVGVRGCVKADLSGNTAYFEHRKIGGRFIEASHDAQYRTSTQPAIWLKSHLLTLLGTGDYNPWQFELQGKPEVSNGRIIGTMNQDIKFANIYYKGSPASYMIEKIPASDLAELRQSGAMTGI